MILQPSMIGFALRVSRMVHASVCVIQKDTGTSVLLYIQDWVDSAPLQVLSAAL